MPSLAQAQWRSNPREGSHGLSVQCAVNQKLCALLSALLDRTPSSSTLAHLSVRSGHVALVFDQRRDSGGGGGIDTLVCVLDAHQPHLSDAHCERGHRGRPHPRTRFGTMHDDAMTGSYLPRASALLTVFQFPRPAPR